MKFHTSTKHEIMTTNQKWDGINAVWLERPRLCLFLKSYTIDPGQRGPGVSQHLDAFDFELLEFFESLPQTRKHPRERH